MGKLACKLCMGAALFALVLQFTSIFRPYIEIGMISLVGFAVNRPFVSCHIYWNTMQVRVRHFGWREVAGMGNEVIRGKDGRARHQANKKAQEWKDDQEREKKQEEEIKGMSPDEQKKIRDSNAGMKAVSAAWEKQFKQKFHRGWCRGYEHQVECIDLPLSQLAAFFGNQGAQLIQAWIPGFPGSHTAAPALYWGGIAVMLSSVFACISLALGAGYLYYYSEVKATKTARKGAMVAMTAAPMLGLLAILAIATMCIFCTPRTGNPIMLIFGSQSGAYWKDGSFIVLFNMLFMGMSLCFSRFWRMRRAERVRKQAKDEEEEDEFMRLMGIDRSGMDEESDDESSDEESEDEADNDDEEQPRASRQPVRPPTIVPSAPVFNHTYTTVPVGQTYTTYTTQAVQQPVTTQRIVIDPNQVGTQRIYI